MVILVGVLLSISVQAAATDRPPLMRKAPYIIYPGDNEEMDVHWQLHELESCVIEWGHETPYGLGQAYTIEYGPDHQHTYTISGLVPGEAYQYRVKAGPEVYTGTFRAALPDDATRLSFLAYGDTRSYPSDHDTVAQAMVDAYLADPEFQTVAIHVGDMVNDGDLESHWDEQFFDPQYTGIQTFLRTIPLQVAIGNHEGDGILFQKYFPYPFVSDRYWSFDYGPCHFTVVDQYVDYSPGSAQLTWVENDLASTTKPWKILYLHEPGWSSGGTHENEIPVQQYIQPLCEEYGVAIVFGGHNHYYARASVSGIEHITTGGGGAPLRPADEGYPFIVTTASEFHFCKVEIDGSQLACEVVMPDGTIIDSFEQELPLGSDVVLPPALSLEQNRPNPFNPRTRLSFTVPRGGAHVTLTVHDIAGRKLRTLLDRVMPAGSARAAWDGRDSRGSTMTSGVYFARLSAGGETTFCKMTLLK